MESDNQRLKEREAYVRAFNGTMVNIWKEKITLLGAVHTGALLDSVVGVRYTTDNKIMSITLEQSFLEYGFYVDAGTGKEVSLGNQGDIGMGKSRKAKPWFYKKHLASLHNLEEFMANNIGQDIAKAISNAITAKVGRQLAVN